MQEMLNVTLNKKLIQPLTAAERKRKQRTKESDIYSGNYKLDRIDEAKRKLEDIYDFNLAALLEMEKFQIPFDAEQLKKLKKFILNHKSKLSKEQYETTQREQEQLNIKEKAQKFGNQQIAELHQSLLTPQTTNERRQLIKSEILKNDFLFLEYMGNQISPFQDFLEMILDMYDLFDVDTKPKLFAKVCALNKGEKLLVDKKMIEDGMIFLTQDRYDSLAAFGLLRLTFQNDISFSGLSIDLLQLFQQKYEQSILNFFKIIPQLKYQIRESLPPTCFCFTSPLFKSLKEEGGDILHTKIPYQFLPYVVEIISYSFTEDEDAFKKFLEVFKLGCKMHSEFLFQTDFSSLLHSINEKNKSRNPLFFMKLEHSTQILQETFDLIKQRKVENFDEETIQLLLESSHEQYQQLKQRPKVLEENSYRLNKQILQIVVDNNKGINFNMTENDLSLSQKEQRVFKAMNISKLLFIQKICFKYCIQQDLRGGHYIQFDTGQGKTSLCFAIASVLAEMNKVFIINKSEDLTFRDFKKANATSKDLKLKVVFVATDEFSGIMAANIVFITIQSFLQYASNNSEGIFDACFCLIDEFDSIFFEHSGQLSQFAQVLTRLQLVIGFSGSDLQYYHKTFLSEQMKSKFITFSLSGQYKALPQIDQQYAFPTQKLFKDNLVRVCLSQIQLTPVLIILKDNFITVHNSLLKVGISVQALFDKDSQTIEGSLQSFNVKQNDLYQVFLLNEAQGRGLDFASTSEIEQNGGVYLIIACIPSYYLQFRQFVGRTGRIGYKGKYSVILLDRESRNQNGQAFLNTKLAQLQNQDLTFITSLKVDTNEKSFGSLQNGNQMTQNASDEQKSYQFGYINANKLSTHNDDSNYSDDNDDDKQNQKPKKKKRDNKEKEKKAQKEQKNQQQQDIDQKKTGVLQQYEECKDCGKPWIEPHTCEIIMEQSQFQTLQLAEIDTQEQHILEQTVHLQVDVKEQKMIVSDATTHVRNDIPLWQQNQSIAQHSLFEGQQNSKVANTTANQGTIAQKGFKTSVNLGKHKAVTQVNILEEDFGNNQNKIQTKSLGKGSIQAIDKSYYSNYGNNEIHKEMLKDKVRMKAYADAIEQQCNDKIVLDVGSGSGVLSGYALKAGAEYVYGVDKANVKKMMNNQLEKMKVNLKESKFEFINDTIESNTAGEKIQKVDVVVSEWMGYFLLFENMIGSYIFAIKNFLKPEGVMIPSEANMFINAAAYGGRVLPRFKEGLAVTDIYCKANYLISDPTNIKKIDFADRINLVNPLGGDGFASNFQIKITKVGVFNAFVGYFDTKLSDDVLLDTSPASPQTHWKQSIFFIENPTQVSVGDIIVGTIKVNVNQENYRNLIIKFTYEVEGKESSKAEEVFTFE